MNKKYLFTVAALVIISIFSLFSALKHLESKSVKEMLGSYTFANTKINLFNLKKIKLINAEGEEITLYYDGIWYFAEAADYFVSEKSLQSFFYVVNKSVLLENIENTPVDSDFFNLKTYDENDNILDDIYFAKDNLSLIKYAGKNNLYKASYTEKIPFSPDGWLPYPLFSVAKELVSAINLNGKYATKASLDEISMYEPDIDNLFNILQNIDYLGIITNDSFDEEYPDADVSVIKLFLVSGLNYRLQIYNTPDGYYLKIIPERELIAKTEVNNIIKNKKLYYDDWMFLLDDIQGAFLYNIKLENTEE